jgi:hypothetical protein
MVRVHLRVIVLAAAMALSAAAGGASLADADAAEALDAHAGAVVALHTELLRLCESAAPGERFALYRTYNHSAGTALQVGFLREILASGPGTGRDAEVVRQAQYTLWEIDQHIADMEDAAAGDDARARIEAALLVLLQDIRPTVGRLARPR